MQKLIASRRELLVREQQRSSALLLPQLASGGPVSPPTRASAVPDQHQERPKSLRSHKMRVLLRLGGLRLGRAPNHAGRSKWVAQWQRLRQQTKGLALTSSLAQQAETHRRFNEKTERQALATLAHQASQPDIAEMYTPDVLDRRFALRHEPSVAAQLRQWWNCAQNLVRDKQAQQAGTRPARQAGAKAKKPPKQQAVPSLKSSTSSRADRLGEQEYFAIFLKVYKAMVDEFSMAEASKAVRDDWQDDCGGKGYLTAESFMDAVFELADVWTETTDAAEYVQFLRRLLDDVTTVDKHGVRRFARTDRIRAGSGQPGALDSTVERHMSTHERDEHLQQTSKKKKRGEGEGASARRTGADDANGDRSKEEGAVTWRYAGGAGALEGRLGRMDESADAQARARSGGDAWRAGGVDGWGGMQRGAGACGDSYEGGGPGRGFGGPAWRAGRQDGWGSTPGGDSGCGMSQTDWCAKRGPAWSMGKRDMRDGQRPSQFDVAFLGPAGYAPLPSVSASSSASCSRLATPGSGHARGAEREVALGSYAQPLGHNRRPATRDGAAGVGSPAWAPLSPGASPPRPATRDGGPLPSPPRASTASRGLQWHIVDGVATEGVVRASRSPVGSRPHSPPRELLHLPAPLAFGRLAELSRSASKSRIGEEWAEGSYEPVGWAGATFDMLAALQTQLERQALSRHRAALVLQRVARGRKARASLAQKKQPRIPSVTLSAASRQRNNSLSAIAEARSHYRS